MVSTWNWIVSQKDLYPKHVCIVSDESSLKDTKPWLILSLKVKFESDSSGIFWECCAWWSLQIKGRAHAELTFNIFVLTLERERISQSWIFSQSCLYQLASDSWSSFAKLGLAYIIFRSRVRPISFFSYRPIPICTHKSHFLNRPIR